MQERREVSRKLASLALSWLRQNERHTVRETEEYRRSLFSAADFLSWTPMGEEPVKTATKDVLKLARSGARSLVKDLEEEVAAKKAELTQVKRVAKSIHKLAKEHEFTEPVEVDYVHTARLPAQGLVTKYQTFVLADAAEATKAAEMIENKLETWNKLRAEMLEELKHHQKQLEEMKRILPEFVATSDGLMRHVLATLH